jgi:hypothetical protein
VINPVHKDAIRSLEVQFPLYSNHTKLKSDLAFKMISSMASLKSLQVGIYAARYKFIFYRVVGSPDLLVGIKGRVLRSIEECPGWRLIKGLQNFTFGVCRIILDGAFLNGVFPNGAKLYTMPGQREIYMAMEEKI